MSSENELVLHYIDKVHVSLLETGKGVNRYAMYVVTMSLLLVALGTGLLDAGKTISISGLSINFPSWVISYVGAWILIFFYGSFLGLITHEQLLHSLVLRLYRSIGFSDKSMEGEWVNPLEYPGVLTISYGYSILGKAHSPILILYLVVLIFFPLVAEGYVAYKLLVSQDYSMLLIFSFCLIFLIGFTHFVALFRSFQGLNKQAVKSFTKS